MDIAETLRQAGEHHAAGRLDEAEAGYETVLRAEPGNAAALGAAAVLAFQRGRRREGLERMVGAVKRHRRDPRLLNDLGNMWRALGKAEKAGEAWRAALEIEAGHADSLANLADLTREAGALDEAAALVERALAAVPMHAAALHQKHLLDSVRASYATAAEALEAEYAAGRVMEDPLFHAQTLAALGRPEAARAILEAEAARRPDDPEIAHGLAALSGEAPPRASDAYVRRHFDDFAETFDARLADLGYRVPERVAAAVGPAPVDLIVDLGCGTGLVGPLVRDRARRLVGVDLSPKMLEGAAGRGCYDALEEAEVTAALEAMAPGSVDIALAADVLVYIGDLAPLSAALARVLVPGGRFIATVETLAAADAAGYRLQPNGRYAHAAPYLAATAGGAGLALAVSEAVELRTGGGQPVAGTLFTLARPGG